MKFINQNDEIMTQVENNNQMNKAEIGKMNIDFLDDAYRSYMSAGPLYGDTRYPEYCYGFCLLVYLFKEGLIEILDNQELYLRNQISYYHLESYGLLKDEKNKWLETGKFSETIVANIDDNEHLQKVFDVILPMMKTNLQTFEDTKSNVSDGENYMFFKQAIAQLSSIEKDWLDRNYANIVIKYCIVPDKRNVIPDYHFSKFCLGLVSEANEIHNISGDYGVMSRFDMHSRFVGYEENPGLWGIGVLVLLSAGLPADNYINAKFDFSSELGKGSVVVDILGLEKPNEDIMRFCYEYESQHFPVDKMLNNLAQDGKYLCAIPKFALYEISRHIRTIPYNESICISPLECVSYIEIIISLPEGLYRNYNEPTALILFAKDKKKKEVKLVNGISFIDERGLQFEKLLDEIEKNNPDFVKIIADEEFGEVALPEYFLFNRNDYIDKIPEGYEFKRLGDIAKIYDGALVNQGEFKVVESVNVCGKEFFREEDYLDIPISSIEKEYIQMDRDLLLYNSTNASLFKYMPDSRVCIDKNILALELDENIIYPPYLRNELLQDYVRKQRSVVGGQTILEIGILIPDIRTQIAKYENEREEYLKGVGHNNGFDINDIREEYKRNLRARRHALNQVLNELSPAISVLGKGISLNNVGDCIIPLKEEVTISEYLKKIEGYAKRMERMVNLLLEDRTFGISEKINVVDFINNYIDSHLVENYQMNFDLLEDGNDYFIYISPRDLEQVFDNIITNANTHGFTDPDRKDYMIRFNVEAKTAEDGTCRTIISISNNGNPLSRGVNQENVFDWGVGRGTGIGSAQVKDIVEHYGGRVFLREQSNADKVIECRIIF